MRDALDGAGFLRSFHDAFPGVTSRALAGGRIDGSRSSYDLVAGFAAARADGTPARAVLDLACGDGHLLDLLAREVPETTRLVGVDFSGGELAAARARLAGCMARAGGLALHHAEAAALPLATGSIDVVLCHLALNLLLPLDAVVGEIRRVLTPGGTLAAVVFGGGFPACAATQAFQRALAHARAQTTAPRRSLADRRTSDPYSLAALFSPEAGFRGATISDLRLALGGHEDDLWAFFASVYDVAGLPERELGHVEAATRAALAESRGGDGQVRAALSLRLLVAHAAG
jgi:SAM-dependent methyltransferase